MLPQLIARNSFSTRGFRLNVEKLIGTRVTIIKCICKLPGATHLIPLVLVLKLPGRDRNSCSVQWRIYMYTFSTGPREGQAGIVSTGAVYLHGTTCYCCVLCPLGAHRSLVSRDIITGSGNAFNPGYKRCELRK